ncbi:CLUMA_CG012248, isoform A [Clunio marinus]|uniref:CLUMA_CG012248, isoform A n=1 Tax=Clunio marinus TaxID=568069 RepID=A0A1J1IEJ7_9DIPT|nr:CLUMA_CG012248, isoform A [Clunio marinus]
MSTETSLLTSSGNKENILRSQLGEISLRLLDFSHKPIPAHTLHESLLEKFRENDVNVLTHTKLEMHFHSLRNSHKIPSGVTAVNEKKYSPNNRLETKTNVWACFAFLSTS